MQLKIIVEQHPDGYVAYPLGANGVLVGRGDSYEGPLQAIEGNAPRALPAARRHRCEDWCANRPNRKQDRRGVAA